MSLISSRALLTSLALLLASFCVSRAIAVAPDPLTPMAELGRLMFFDKTLSGSGRLSCASCHDPVHAHGPPNQLAVQLGGARLKSAGIRAVPSLRYKEATPPYADLLDNPDGISTPGPGGGLMQDGSAATLAEQAHLPLLNPIEMANRSAADVAKHLRQAGYAARFQEVFGDQAMADPKQALDAAGRALQAFQLEDRSFHPYSSRYDLYAGNKIGGAMSPAEQRGFAVYNDPDKGNCFACHYNGAGLNGSTALFTDFTYAAIGVPRNAGIPANRSARYADLGLCGRADHQGAANAKYCGEFKTPTLRNVATRDVFFHNGRIRSLAEAIAFYNTRDTDPGRWYPTARGKVHKYDDLPARFHANIDSQKPLDGRAAGSTPPMTAQETADLEAFLEMLTDKDAVPQIRHPVALRAAEAAVTGYLATHGNLCLGKMDWPVDVSELDLRAQGRDAVQMPVLAELGLVRPRAATALRREGPGFRDDDQLAPVPVAVTRYELTPAGRAWLRQREVIAPNGPQGDRVVRRDDLCVATLALGRVTGWRPTAGSPDFVASYTYTAKPAPWSAAPAFRRVFPLVAHVLDGVGQQELRQRFRPADGAWVASGLAD